MVLILSSLLTAEISGGFWNKLPVKVPKTFLRLISFSIGPCSLTMAIYSLPADCWDLTSLVALIWYEKYLPVQTDNKASCDFGIQSTRVTGFFNSQDLFDPGNDFVWAGIGGFVQVDAAVLKIFLDGSFERGRSSGDRSIVVGKNVHFIVVFEEKGPLGAVEGHFFIGRFDGELLLSINLFFDFLLDKLFIFFLIFSHGCWIKIMESIIFI